MSIANYPGFDPYQQWLGIPPNEQPPNYYRLLGMPLFEQNMYQIAAAADGLLQFFQGITDPQYAPAAARIYEEVYSARVSLTDPGRKAQYDAWLQSQGYQPQGYSQPYQAGYDQQGYQATGYAQPPQQNYQQPPQQTYQQTGYETYQQPGYGQTYQQPGYSQPPQQSYEQPTYEQPPQQPPVQPPQQTYEQPAYEQPPVQSQKPPVQESQPPAPAAQDNTTQDNAGSGALFPPGYKSSSDSATSKPEAPPQPEPSPQPPVQSPQPQTYGQAGNGQPSNGSPPTSPAPAPQPQPGYSQPEGSGAYAVGQSPSPSPYGGSGSGAYAVGGSATYGPATGSGAYAGQGSGAYAAQNAAAYPNPGSSTFPAGSPGSGTYPGAGSGGQQAVGGSMGTIPPEPSSTTSTAPDSVEMAVSGWQVGNRHPSPGTGEELPPVRRKPHAMVMVTGGAIVLGILALVIVRSMPKTPARHRAAVAQQTVDPLPKTNEAKANPVSRPPRVVPGGEPDETEPVTTVPDEPAEPKTTEPEPKTPEPKTTEPEPVVVEPKTRPKPEPKTQPQPEPEPQPQPQPEPEPKPEPAVVLDPAAAADVKQKLGAARLAMAQRDLSLARERLQSLKGMKLPEKEAKERMRLNALVGHLEIFWNQAVKGGLEALKESDEVVINEKRIAVVEASDSRIILRMSGRNKTYYIDSMPTVLVMNLANRWFKQVASSKVYIGSFYAMDFQGDRDEARRLWQAARSEGGEGERDAVDLVMPELDVPLPETKSSLIPK